MEAIYVRFEGRYWRLSALLSRYNITYSAGYKRHIAYGRPKVYKRWMLAPLSTVITPIAVTIDGVPYRSIKEASLALNQPKNRIGRRVRRFGAILTMELITMDDPRGGLKNLKKAKKVSEWDLLSNKTNTGAARV